MGTKPETFFQGAECTLLTPSRCSAADAPGQCWQGADGWPWIGLLGSSRGRKGWEKHSLTPAHLVVDFKLSCLRWVLAGVRLQPCLCPLKCLIDPGPGWQAQLPICPLACLVTEDLPGNYWAPGWPQSLSLSQPCSPLWLLWDWASW